MRLPLIPPAAAIAALLFTGTGHALAEDHPLGAMLDPHHRSHVIYPPAELELHRAGEAHVHCTISATGVATECQSSASQPDFGLAAEQMAYNSTFLPAYKNGVPTQSTWDNTYHFKDTSDVTQPRIDRAHTSPPHYPEAANAAGLGAHLTVTCQIDEIGVAHDCTVSDGPAILQRAALAYFSFARYYPALQNGKPVAMEHHWDIDWDVSHPVDQQGFR